MEALNEDEPPPYIQTIEWNMMNKQKFFPLSMLSTFSIRCILYPFTVIKTRIQIQKHSEAYKGTYDAFQKILCHEGPGGLYKGFWVSIFQIVSGMFYITTYENVRHFLQKNKVENSRIRALAGGGCASLVSQTIIVPFDIISQHVMVLGQKEGSGKSRKILNPLNIEYKGCSRTQVAYAIIQQLYKRDGIPGFYRGYFASLLAYVPNSALWWTFYHFYQEHLVRIAPSGSSTLMLQVIAAALGGTTTTFLTNPLDTVRARLQVQCAGGYWHTFSVLWDEERLRIFTKGLSPRLFQSVIFSSMVIFGYESVKRFSVSDEYKNDVRW